MPDGANGTTSTKGKGKDARPALSALQPLYDSTHHRDQEKCPPKVSCFPGTRRDVTKKLMAWTSSDLTAFSHVCWLHGGTGEGKSTVAQEICMKLEKKKRLAGSYFWSRTSNERNTWQAVAPTLAHQVASTIPGTGELIEKVLREEPNVLKSYISLANQVDKLVYGPCKAVLCGKKSLANAIMRSSQAPYIIVLDGIDGCYDQDQLFDFVERAGKFFVENPKIPLRLLICGRINARFALLARVQAISLLDLAAHSTRQDVAAFVRDSLSKHSQGDIKVVEDVAQASFAVAVPLVDYVLEPNSDALPLNTVHLDKFYAHILARGSDLPHSCDILSALTLLKRPLPVTDLAKFLGISTYEVNSYLSAISPIVLVPGADDDLPLSFFHDGVKDFLLDETRSQSHHIDKFVLRSAVYSYLDLTIVHYEGLSEESWMLPMDMAITQCILNWPNHLDLVKEADPTFDVTGFDSRYTRILSRIQFLPLFPEVLAILALMGANSPDRDVQIVHILAILQVPLGDIELILHGLAPLVAVGKGAATRVAGSISMSNRCSLRHESIREFLLEPARSHDLAIAPAQYTYLSLRFMEIVFAVPVMFVNDRMFFATWPKYLAMAVEKDPMYDLDALEEPFRLLPPSHRARVVATHAWQDALVLVLEPPEIETLKENLAEAIAAIRAKVPDAFNGVEEAFFKEKAEKVQGLSSPRLLNGLVSPPSRKVTGAVIASRHPVTTVDILEGMRLLIDSKVDSRFCMPRGAGLGLQIERYEKTTNNNQFLLSLYQYTEPEEPNDSEDENDVQRLQLQDGANPFEPDIQEVERERLIPSGSVTQNY